MRKSAATATKIHSNSSLRFSQHKNESGWADLSRTFSEKIIHLEKLLAQESSKAKMMEQILRSGGLELQMELKNKENGGEQETDIDNEDREYTQKVRRAISHRQPIHHLIN